MSIERSLTIKLKPASSRIKEYPATFSRPTPTYESFNKNAEDI